MGRAPDDTDVNVSRRTAVTQPVNNPRVLTYDAPVRMQDAYQMFSLFLIPLFVGFEAARLGASHLCRLTMRIQSRHVTSIEMATNSVVAAQ